MAIPSLQVGECIKDKTFHRLETAMACRKRWEEVPLTSHQPWPEVEWPGSALGHLLFQMKPCEQDDTKMLQKYCKFIRILIILGYIKYKMRYTRRHFFLKKTEGCPTCEHFINLVADSEWIILVVVEESASNDGGFLCSLFLVPRVPHDANLGCQQIAVQLFIFTLIQLVHTLYSFIFNYFLKKFIFYINNF